MNGLWAKIHKWLALLMAIQVLFWFVSGLFFAAVPIEWVRSEHTKAAAPAAPVAADAAAAGLALLAREGVTGERIEIRTLLGHPVALVVPREGRSRLYDLSTGRAAGPISAVAAARIAEADHQGELRAVRVTEVTTASPEYRGALPAWRVDFDDGANRALYVAADSGAVTARRSTLWRVYDFLWALHIMDWRGHEDFNSWLLAIATALGLVIVVSGIVLLPSRLGYTAWRRRRRAVSAERIRNAAPPREQDRLIGLAMRAMLHPRRSHRHSRNRDARRLRPLAEQPANIGGGHMALHRIAADAGGVAGAQIVGDSEPPGEGRRIRHVAHPDLEARLAHVRDPAAATAAGRRLHHIDRRPSLGPDRNRDTGGQCGKQASSRQLHRYLLQFTRG